MKKLVFVAVALLLSASLFSCGDVNDEAQNKERKQEVKNQGFKREMIIVDSVNDPLPPKASNVQSMPSKNEPQQIPNANLNDPIVITKMPHFEKKRP
jgi:hypothetical protein